MGYTKYLEDLENRINVETEKNLYNDWLRFAEGKVTIRDDSAMNLSP